MISLMLMGTLLVTWATTSQAEMGFDPRYERDYNIFTPAHQYAPDNPLNPANRYNVDVPFAPLDGKGKSKR